MTEIKLTELEAIELTIKHGYKGEELELACWKKNGSLDGKRDKVTGEFKEGNMIKFIRKLETIYNNVSAEGKGKKRIYTLSDKKEVISEIQDNRKGNGLTEDDYVMSKYFHMQLFDMDLNYPKTSYRWITDVGAINVYHNEVSYEEVKNYFKELYNFDEPEIIETFKSHIKNRSRSVGTNCINILKRDGLIDTTNFYMAKKLNDEVIFISEIKYDEFTDRRNEIIKLHGLKHWNYEWALTINNTKYVDYQNDMKALFEEFGFKMVWISIKIQLLTKEKPKYIIDELELNKDDFQYAYFNKMYHLLNNPKKKRTIRNNMFSSKFFKFNISCILDSICKPVYNFMKDVEEPHPFEISDVLHHKGKYDKRIDDLLAGEEVDFEVIKVGNTDIEEINSFFDKTKKFTNNININHKKYFRNSIMKVA